MTMLVLPSFLTRLRPTAMALIVLVVCVPMFVRCAEPVKVDVLVGSELDDLRPILSDIASATGVQMTLHEVGTLKGAEMIAAGKGYGMAWFSTNRFLDLLPGVTRKVIAEKPTMLSPVVLGVKQSVARRLG